MNEREIYELVEEIIDKIEAKTEEQLPKAYEESLEKILTDIRREYVPKSPSDTITPEKVTEYFEKTWEIYPRKVNKVQARKSYANKFRGVSEDEGRAVANKIYFGVENQKILWSRENGGNGRELDKTPHFSTWLNANVEDAPKKRVRG